MRSQAATFEPLFSPGIKDEFGDLRFRALIFRAAHYFAQVAALRVRLPHWASRGALSVTHAELGDGRFLFKLEIIHPRLGRLICQTAAFQEAHP